MAVSLYRKAADQGNALAKQALGRLHDPTRTNPQDEDEQQGF
jgi:TPR repeat protein